MRSVAPRGSDQGGHDNQASSWRDRGNGFVMRRGESGGDGGGPNYNVNTAAPFYCHLDQGLAISSIAWPGQGLSSPTSLSRDSRLWAGPKWSTKGSATTMPRQSGWYSGSSSNGFSQMIRRALLRRLRMASSNR